MNYDSTRHAAARTKDYVFSQLIPYIGSKRKLLGLIGRALGDTGTERGKFFDAFAGSGVVSRFAKTLGYQVISNDWEPYSYEINRCCVGCNTAPPFSSLGGYSAAIATLNALPDRVDWVTDHLCPRDDENYDVTVDRMFYMRRNGMRIDAIRHQIAEWERSGVLHDCERSCLLAPLLYEACYRSNTSGVFKGFHNGWGGQTKTALYRIAADLQLRPAELFDNAQENVVLRDDARSASAAIGHLDVAYLDPPYNQHPYGSNYHVLNTIALWDDPPLPTRITAGTKAGIRTDWRTQRRSPYNYRAEAVKAYRALLDTLDADWIITSYSTEGLIETEDMLEANARRGRVTVYATEYKRYRVSSQRFSEKPVNVEFALLVDTRKTNLTPPDVLAEGIREIETRALARRSGEPQRATQVSLFGE